MTNDRISRPVRAHVVTSAPCKLARGGLRRFPQNRRSWPMGYHVCCPRCGFVSVALNGKGLEIDESLAGEVTFSKPLRCIYCQVLIHLERCVIQLEEDEHVRPLQYH